MLNVTKKFELAYSPAAAGRAALTCTWPGCEDAPRRQVTPVHHESVIMVLKSEVFLPEYVTVQVWSPIICCTCTDSLLRESERKKDSRRASVSSILQLVLNVQVYNQNVQHLC
jgi:hypothetical protein